MPSDAIVPVTVGDVVRNLDAWAPPGQKADFDRVGLQVGDASAEVSGVVVALDLTPDVIAEAERVGAALIVTHHPLLFKPIGQVTADHPVGSLVWRLARAGISFAAVHTNLDAAWGGVSFALAELLGVRELEILSPLSEVMRTVVTFVPESAADAVRQSMSEAGAGRIGDYAECSFSVAGTGRFLPLDGSNPSSGTVGRAHAEVEVRVEVAVPTWRVSAVRRSITKSHPYETPVIDVYANDAQTTRQGYGAIGTLEEPRLLPEFLSQVRDALGAGALRYVGGDGQSISRVAVCGGSGLSFLPDALRTGADAFVTADVTYHRWFEALGTDGRPSIALIDAGHYETETVAEALLADRLRQSFPSLDVRRTETRTSPMRTFTGKI